MSIIKYYVSLVLFGQGSITSLGGFLLTVVVDILTAVGAVDALIVKSPQEATTVTAECWKVVVLGTEIVRVSLLVVHIRINYSGTVVTYDLYLGQFNATLQCSVQVHVLLAKAHPLDNFTCLSIDY